MYSYCSIKNISGEARTLKGKQFDINEAYTIPDSERISWATSDAVLEAITSLYFQINLLSGISDQISILKNDNPIEVTPLDKKNDHRLEPWGCAKGLIVPTNNTCDITLSNKTVDELTFTYNSNVPIVPSIGNYIFQSNHTIRSWIIDVDTQNYTITVDLAGLDNGTAQYRKGIYVDCLVRDWRDMMYLWGLFVTAINYENDDFVEFVVVDKDDLLLDDTYCTAIFGCDAATAAPIIAELGFEDIGEFDGHLAKYYDESWIINMTGKAIMSPDGAPGSLLIGLYLRATYFSANASNTGTSVYVDYIPTSKV